MTGQMTIDGKTVKAAKKPRRKFAACPNCGGTHFIEEQYPAYLQWTCRIGRDGHPTAYSRTPEVDGDPEVLSYTCTTCRAEYHSTCQIVRDENDEDEEEGAVS